jgi:IclR family transcriptional regulator, acetate operon repressor
MVGDVMGDEERLVGADRVLAVLVELAEHPQGISLDEMASILRSSKPTVHRALASLRRAKLAALSSRGVYTLGDEFFRMAFWNYQARPESEHVRPILEEFATTFGETTHYAVLEGAEVVYRAKVDPPAGAVRLTSVIGGRNPAYATAVGKLLLGFEVDSIEQLIGRMENTTFEARTPMTISTVEELWTQIQASRAAGFAVDDQENEVGVNCVAVPVFTSGSPRPTGAISVSALAFRCPLAKLKESVPEIQQRVFDVFGQPDATSLGTRAGRG